ncbi:MAG: sensor histidine kinase, partial [Oscillospiraceae bacterium]|nr:sensor histidine kinase [Oscillospiraceae bacterium]
VTITVQEEQEQTQVSVINRGSEIDPARMDRIFQKFYQGDPSHAAEGNGIGLAIVKRVTELHGGSVRAASRDGSTCFTVTLPKSPRQSAQ